MCAKRKSSSKRAASAPKKPVSTVKMFVMRCSATAVRHCPGLVPAMTPWFRDAMRWMVVNRNAYHVVKDDELAKSSGIEHHKGVFFF